jgi:hypothetical protein
MWSIGIYTGRSPFDLAAPPGAGNPVLSARSVHDVPARFVADPFLVRHEGLWHMLFEVLNDDTNRGEIGWAFSADARRWSYRRIVLTEPFHLSYPHIVEDRGEYFMTPETLVCGRVRLYRCLDFPHAWAHTADLVEGRCADPTLFRHEDAWWMFVCTPPEKHATLRLFHAPELAGPWSEHRASPIVADDPTAARPAGRVVAWNGTLLRFAQDCRPRYGTRVRAFEVLRLNRYEYVERPAGDRPVLGPGDAAWNGARMHHIDLHPAPDGTWLAGVDGFALDGPVQTLNAAAETP